MGPFHRYPVQPPPPPGPWGTSERSDRYQHQQSYPYAYPYPYPGSYGPPLSLAPPPRPAAMESKAVASLVLGILSLACVGIFTGLPAIILGAIARRDIERSNGNLVGRKL